MKKTKKVTKTEVVNETVDIICNKCGKTCNNIARQNYDKKHGKDFYGILELEVHGGYNSATIGDMVSWRFSLCEFCVKELVDTFKIPHEIHDRDLSGDYVSLAKNAKLLLQHDKINHQEWVKAILETKSGHKKKELENKNHKELYDIYHNLQAERRKIKAKT